MRARRSSVLLCVFVTAFVFASGTAFAANSGEPVSGIPDLIPTQYGRVTNQSDQTQPNGLRSNYPNCGTTEGAAAYKFGAPAGTVLDVDLTDDTSGQSVCRVELLASGSGALTSIYDAAQRDAHRIGFDECPLAASTCHERWAALPADTYYLVVWPAGNDSPNFAGFTLSAAVRKPTSTAFSLTGAHRTQRSGWYLVTKGMKLVASATASPADVTGQVQFRIDRYTSGTWRRWSQSTIALSSARASVKIALSQHGLFYVYAVTLGDDTHAQSISRKQGVVVQTPTTQRGVISGYFRIDHAEDYFVFKPHAYVTAVTTILPADATGWVTFQWYRLVSVGHTSFIRSVNVRVVKSRAAWRFAIRDPWHFYRIGTIYRGDATHLPSSTKLMCIEVY